MDKEEDIAADEDEPLQLIENEDILSEPPVNEEEGATVRNVITETARAVVRLQSEKESFKCLVSEEILRAVLMHTNRKMQQIQRNLHACYSTNAFSMEELKADIAIVLRAGRDRDNFSDLIDLWNPSDSRPFYRTLNASESTETFITMPLC